MAPIVPQDREDTTKPPRILDHLLASIPSLLLGKIEVLRVKERPVLNVQGEFQEDPRVEGTKDLPGSSLVTNRLVVADGRIVRVTSPFQSLRGAVVSEQPVHANTQRILLNDRRDPGRLLTPSFRTMPGVDPVDADLASGI